MKPVLELFQGEQIVECKVGEKILIEGQNCHTLYVLISGSVEIRKGHMPVGRIAEPGSIFGEMSVLLDIPHTADVEVVENSFFYLADTGFIWSHPEFYKHVCIQLAARLRAVTQYLADQKIPFHGVITSPLSPREPPAAFTLAKADVMQSN